METLTGIENAIGSEGNTVLMGDDGDNVLEGGDGNDTLSGGDGNDTLAGDATHLGDGDVDLNAEVGAGGRNTANNGGNRDTVGAFNDYLNAGEDKDTFVGDVARSGSGNLSLSILAGNGGYGYDNRTGGAGGSDNIIEAFSDAMDAGAGDDSLAGDVTHSGDGHVYLSTEVGTGGSGGDDWNGGAGGSGNTLEAFNDTIDGGGGDDSLAGDITHSGDGNVYLSAQVGTGGDISHYRYDDGFEPLGGTGGSDNTVEVFSDTIDAGAGNDTVVGDVHHAGTSGAITLSVMAGVEGRRNDDGDAASGGTGNEAGAFNDTIDAGGGDDLIVGDVWRADDGVTLAISVEGTAGSTIRAFQDDIAGGGGDDTIYGDFFDGTGDFAPDTLTIDGTFAGRDALFADTIDGGAGDDVIHGGLGDDILGGGSGEDSFEGGDGSDTVDYSYSASDRLRVDLSEGFAWFVDDPTRPAGPGNEASTTEALTSIENVIGTTGDNVLIGDANDNVLGGLGGQDTFDGGGGSDTVDYSYSSSDRLRVDLSEGFAWFVDDPTRPAGPGNEASTAEALISIENVIGTTGDNVLIGDANDNVLGGLGGQDTFDGGGGSDTVDYSYSSSNTLEIDLAAGLAMFMSSGVTEILTSIENAIGSYGDTVLRGDDGDNVLEGGDGDDTLNGGIGTDNLDGGEGSDTADYSYSSSDTLEIDLAAGLATFMSSGVTETLTSIENAIGSEGNTVLMGDDGDNVLVGGDGDDTLNGRDGNDTLNGRDGDDTAAGDVLAAGVEVVLSAEAGVGEDSIKNENNQHGTNGNGGESDIAVSNFNDDLDGGGGNDDLAGDVRHVGGGRVSLSGKAGSGGRGIFFYSGDGGDGGNDNTVTAFNDRLTAGVGDDTIAGDVTHSGGGDVDLNAEAGVGGRDSGGRGGHRNTAATFNDTIDAGSGDDSIAGDVTHSGDGDVGLSAKIGTGGRSLRSGNGGSDNVAAAFNDTVSAGSGRDTISGDVTHSGDGDVGLSARVGASARDIGGGRGAGGSDNIVATFNDTISVGSGDGIIVGDVTHSGDGKVNLSVAVGTGAGITDYENGGVGGNRNTVGAFNDRLSAGEDKDTFVGDVAHSGSGDLSLSILAGNGGRGYDNRIGGAGGSDNILEAFSDAMDAGAGDDSLVGDVTHSGDGRVYLSAEVGTGGVAEPDNIDIPDILSGDGGSDNTVEVFSDTIDAGVGNDTVVGDVHHAGTSGAITLSVMAGVEGRRNDDGDAASGGTGNEAGAFNDTIDAGGGDDLIVGDVWRADDGVTLAISVEGTAGSTIRAFQDDIAGGGGDDTIYGDFFDGTGDFAPDTLTIDGTFAGRDALFADTIDGGAGDDVIHGGLGDDILGGGSGEDSFEGGDGSDTVDYSYSASDRLRVDLSEGFAWFVDDPTRPAGPGNEASTTEALTSIENVIGTTGDNVLIGDANDNVLGGLGGQDTFDGGGGSDTVDYSYSSSDRLRVDLSEGFAWFVDDPTRPAGPGNEASTAEALISIENVIGTTGDNVLIGDANDNVLGGLGGQDTFDGGGGSDTVDYSYSSSNTLEIDLAAGLATFMSSGVTEILTSIENAIGSYGDTVLRGDDGDNVLEGGDGDDTLNGRGGDDALIGGNGDDTLNGGVGTDSLDGGDGSDTADYSYSSSGTLEIDLAAGLATFVSSGVTETLTSIEHAIGSDGNTVLMGDDGDNVLDGGAGDDTLNGRDGDDTLIGGEGEDVFVFTPSESSDYSERVIDFTPGEDMIDLTAFAFEDVDDVPISQSGDNGRLELSGVGGPRVTFEFSGLSPDDFLL